jgi:redox-sensitive bicupin YhaK (pirin superfamily)
MQWISAGSGIEHAEGGGTPAGETQTGFQLWINVPSSMKMDDPSYGTHPAEDLTAVALEGGVTARVLAGPFRGSSGPFKTKVPVSLIHYELPEGATVVHAVPRGMDNAMLYVFRGSVNVGGTALLQHQVARLDASSDAVRTVTLTSGEEGAGVMLFAGKMLRQPIAWRGPIVMTTQAEVQDAFSDLRSGRFPPKRVAWDYRKLHAFPANHPAHVGA